MKNNKTAINPTRSQDYPKWYQEVIKAADLAENSIVRGCMVVKPWGYAVWENIKSQLDKMIKETNHQNFYFPLFVPLSFMAKEAEHVDGFATECAVVTHHKLVKDDEKILKPAGELEEPLVVRPTSEAIIGEAYARWINSYRDLPLLGNQWANVVRWEMRPRMFLRTSEFLWQEGHTAHSNKVEAILETEKMLEVYRNLAEEYLAMPVLLGKKTESEKFPGADITYCIEAMMQDKKALQAGTSHFLGQNFAKAFNIKYLSKEGKEELCWTTSWGVSTRLIGGMIMCHSDDNGLKLPPKLAPLHVVIIPFVKKNQDNQALLDYTNELASKLKQQNFNNENIRVEIDDSDYSFGEKSWKWIKKGVPLKVEIGAREIENNQLSIVRRDQDLKEKLSLSADDFISQVSSLLDDIQDNMFNEAKSFLDANSFTAKNKDEFYSHFENDKSAFVTAFYSENLETEKKLKADLKVTARCIELKNDNETGKCIFTGADNAKLTVFAKSY